MEQNIQKKFNQAQNEVRLAIMDFIINENGLLIWKPTDLAH